MLMFWIGNFIFKIYFTINIHDHKNVSINHVLMQDSKTTFKFNTIYILVS